MDQLDRNLVHDKPKYKNIILLFSLKYLNVLLSNVFTSNPNVDVLRA